MGVIIEIWYHMSPSGGGGGGGGGGGTHSEDEIVRIASWLSLRPFLNRCKILLQSICALLRLTCGNHVLSDHFRNLY